MRRSIRLAAAGLAILALASGGCALETSRSASPSPTAADALTIYYGDAAQFEIVTPSGRVVFIDVWNPTALVNRPTSKDILLTTHSHNDHYSADFEGSFPGQKITFEATTLKVGDISIESIPALHNEGEEYEQKNGPDYIFIVDVAGMRLAHFGDIGQDRLTAEQLARLGQVDVAFSQLANTFSTMDEMNRKGFNLMNQVKPRLLITTHVSNAVVELTPKIWKAAWATGPVTISKAGLPAETTCLFMGPQASGYGKVYGIPAFGS